MKAGIVGLPNVGKSSLFNCFSNAKAQSANFPFCTIEPNIGTVNVPDSRINVLESIVKPEKVIPACIEIVDIAGLVKGASKGEGLGNQFLSNIRETDAIIHVLRCFDNERIIHVHCKDMRKRILDKSIQNDYSFRKAFLEGAFTVPGDGCIDYKPFLNILKNVNYCGWLVVEAEQDPAKANPYEYSKKGFDYLFKTAKNCGFEIIN